MECNNCRLIEDLAANGKLFTYFGEDVAPDTGLRFVELDEETFQCPTCEKKIKLEV